MSINEQEKEGVLLIENSDYSEYSLLNVRGMDAAAQGTEPEEAKNLWSCLKS